MSLSMYQASVPVFLRGLANLSAILDKAAANAEVRKIDPAVFVNARLAPDMFPLAGQVRMVTVHAKGAGARLAGIEVPNYDDSKTTIAELQSRIARTVAFLNDLTADQIDGSEDRAVVLTMRGKEVRFTGREYLFNFILPNFYFHATAAYAILRHNGVDIGPLDYIGGLPS